MNEGLKIYLCCTTTQISRNYYTYIPSLLGVFPDGSDSKESACNAGDPGLIPGSGRSPGGGHGYSVQYCSLDNHHGQSSLADYSPRGYTESATTERSTLSFSFLMSLPPWPHPHPSRSAQSAKLGSLCYIATSHQLSILHQNNIAKQFSSSKKKKKRKEKKMYLWQNGLNIDKNVRKLER